MKNTTLLIIILAIALGLAACTGSTIADNQAPTAAPATEPTPAPAAAEAEPTAAPANTSIVSLKYDETGGVQLTPGQTALIATYLRLTAPISQQQLEKAVGQIQQEAASAKAEVHEGSTLTLDDRQAWFVWCSDGSQVDEPADVSNTLDKLYATETLGRVWVQNVFAPEVPARGDNTWKGCNGTFWAVALH